MEMEQVTTKLAQRVADKYSSLHKQPSGQDSPVQQTPSQPRLIIAMAGGPGSGKSTIADEIRQLVTSTHGLSCQTIELDGFMLPRVAIDEMENSEHAHERRGCVWTFDGHAVVDLIRRCRFQTEKDYIKAPELDEDKMEPHPHGTVIDKGTQVLIFEGVYLLADTEPWNQIEDLVDDRWFVHVDAELSRKRVAERRNSKGIEKDLDECYRQYDATDGKNNAFITEHRGKVDLIIENNDEKGLHEPEE